MLAEQGIPKIQGHYFFGRNSFKILRLTSKMCLVIWISLGQTCVHL
jgi:hypothetical protein